MRKMVKARIFVTLLIFSLFSSSLTVATPVSYAKSGIKLSRIKKTYVVRNVWDNLTLKNVPSGAKITWKSSDTKVVKIKYKEKNGIWYKVLRNGSARITARYKGKSYVCRIRVKASTPSTPTPKPTKQPDTTDDDYADIDTSNIRLNATEVKLYYCSKELKPYVHKDEHPTKFQFEVSGTDIKPTWKLDFDTAPGLNISSDGLLSVADAYMSKKKEATVIAIFPGSLNNMRLTAHVVIESEIAPALKEKVDDFKARYITSDMTDYEKVEAVCRFVANEHSYKIGQYDWVLMLFSGEGDCYATRVAVEYLCNELGIKCYACRSLDNHGEAIVKLGSTYYMTVTGYDTDRPNAYSIYELSDEAVAKYMEKYPNMKVVFSYN